MARPRNTTDAQILEEARACFLEHGAGASTTLIAERLGISHGVLFQRFGTKEQLLRAALLPSPAQPWMAQVRAGPDDRDVRTQILELAEEISTYLERIVPALAVLRSAGVQVESLAERREELPPVRARREVAGWFSRAIERGLLRRVRPEHATDLFLGALQFRPFHQHLSSQGFDGPDNHAYRQFVVDTIYGTLAPTGEPP
ncbi:TetR/AcrR family transcriptional regulator [Nannocystis radixulma]|uniref:TetR/AcrR family transcriptional regulator n=1 Tax=Nannocystis radixulma TaxID=2995305 RepID=A0ABT5AXR5_9BACT|nr:TetR/AcrR family transcriptional regulator [Nannocystis radixulma]MDC0666273.1 TetR/AcrR family transcriptional regulator [Nannocystis radixulma]